MAFDAASPVAGNLLQSYGPGGFTVNGTLHPHSILLTPDLILPLEGAITLESLAPLLGNLPKLEFLVLGMGKQLQPVPAALRNAIRAQGMAVDSMDSGAACRTYAIMHSEGRRVGAALLLPSA